MPSKTFEGNWWLFSSISYESENFSHQSLHKSSCILAQKNKTIKKREEPSTFSFWFIFLDFWFLVFSFLFWYQHESSIQLFSSYLLAFRPCISSDCFLFFFLGFLFCLLELLSPCSKFLNVMPIFCWDHLIFCSEKELLLSFWISDGVNVLVWGQPSF